MKGLTSSLALVLLWLSPHSPSAAQEAAEGQAAPPAAQKISIPLSDPGRPAVVKVSLVQGGVTVEGYGGKEVVIEAAGPAEREGHSRGKHGKSTQGMRRIPNTDLGLTAEEENNVVRVETKSYARPVDLKILVPVNTSLHLSTVNSGDIKVTGVAGELELANVNGGIVAKDVSGSVVAHTTNGDLKIAFTRLDKTKTMAFSTLNGDVDVTFPADLKANIRLRSDRGEIYSDFELATSARSTPTAKESTHGRKRRIEMDQEMQGTIGGGGPELRFQTFNGDIYLRKGRG
ncbi:MAG TPA: DUF4097 family beta strand repeat-containing protein [Thermoanaerobaculia bacterium]|nr:DUF4097 family beta strand repeat-containing protein [Thermoanaerobaculia bacterium]